MVNLDMDVMRAIFWMGVDEYHHGVALDHAPYQQDPEKYNVWMAGRMAAHIAGVQPRDSVHV